MFFKRAKLLISFELKSWNLLIYRNFLKEKIIWCIILCIKLKQIFPTFLSVQCETVACKFPIKFFSYRDTENPWGFNHTQRIMGNWGIQRGREIVLSREERTNWLSNTKFWALKTYTQVTLYRPIRLYLGICVHVHIFT